MKRDDNAFIEETEDSSEKWKAMDYVFSLLKLKSSSMSSIIRAGSSYRGALGPVQVRGPGPGPGAGPPHPTPLVSARLVVIATLLAHFH